MSAGFSQLWFLHRESASCRQAERCTGVTLPVLRIVAAVLLANCALDLPMSRAAEPSVAADSVTISAFGGALAQPVDGQESILRRFEVQLITSPTRSFFHVLDDARSGCPWPDSFGLVSSTGESNGVEPHLLYHYEGNPYSIGLPPLIVRIPSDAVADASWEQSGWKLTLVERRRIDGVDCWLIEASERRGRRQTLTAEAGSGILLKAQADVFMGQGVRFRLTMERTSITTVDGDAAEQLTKLQDGLLGLQKALNRRVDSQLSELSTRQIETAAAERESLHTAAAGTVLQSLVMRLSNDLERQQKRLMAVRDRAGQLLNSAAPEFSLNLVSGGSLESQSLKGQIVVLHFWDYRDQPLSEPYGQTGYLDFVFNQKRKSNVQVVGISTSAEFQNADTLNRARRSARKLAEFMNLTYPIAYDDGALLRTLGDPRDSNGQLPLWVVLTPDGRVTHYHAGFYEIDTTRGLKELDAVLTEQIQKTR